MLVSVVAPNDSFSRAYSAFPTRIRVSSSSCTTAASTFSRGMPGSARCLFTYARKCTPDVHDSVVLGGVADLAPLRVVAACFRPRASRPVAWRWPFGYRQIQTSVQAGGICRSGRREPAADLIDKV